MKLTRKLKVVLWSAMVLGLAAGLASSVNIHGNVINADTGFQVNGAAPLNHPLCGNGSVYADSSVAVCGTSATLSDQYASVAGCSFANDGSGLNCTPTSITWGSAFSDTSYVVSCSVSYTNAVVTAGSGLPNIIVSTSNTDTTHTAITEGVGTGGSTTWAISPSYGATVICHGHHS